VGEDGQMYHNALNDSGWSPSWEALGYPECGGFDLVTKPAAASRAAYCLDVFAVGADGQMYCKYWVNDSWNMGWQSLGSPPPSGGYFHVQFAPAAVASAGNWLDVFAVGYDFQIYQKAWFADSWTDWGHLGVLEWFNGTPAVVSWGPDRLDIFAVGPDGGMHHKAWADSWVPPYLLWEALGAAPCEGGFNINSAPAAATWGAGRVDVFAVGAADGQMYHKYWALPSPPLNEVIETRKHASRRRGGSRSPSRSRHPSASA
jgi:hypothetical protein